MVVKSAFYTTIRLALPQAPLDRKPSEPPGFLQPRWPTSQIAPPPRSTSNCPRRPRSAERLGVPVLDEAGLLELLPG